MNGSRSRTDLSNLQEVKDSGGDISKGLAQYYTPSYVVDRIIAKLREYKGGLYPDTVIDPQAGGRALLDAFPFSTIKYGIDIKPPDDISYRNYITGDCRKVGEIITDLYPSMTWECGVANYPFGLRWKGISPWEWTWNFLQQHTQYGCMIGADNEVAHLADHESVWHTETRRWPHANVVVRLLYYSTNIRPTTYTYGWEDIERCTMEERSSMPEYNVWIKESNVARNDGALGVYLSVRDKLKYVISPEEAKRLMTLDGSTPQILSVDRETRKLLGSLVDAGVYKISPDAEEAIRAAIREAQRVATPIMPVTDFERIAYLDEEDTVRCFSSWGPFKKGVTYSVDSRSYTFKQQFTRRKPRLNEELGIMESVIHECVLSGQDRKIIIDGKYEFLSNPDPDEPNQFEESLLWSIFERPPVLTVNEKYPDKVSQNRELLNAMEVISGFNFYSGQIGYLSRLLVNNYALAAAQTGCGKTVMAIASYVVKGANRCLVACPKGVAYSSGDQLSQWVSEIHQFAPFVEVFTLFSEEDVNRIMRLNNGELPPGFYVTYYDAFYKNGGIEQCSMLKADTPRWNDKKLYDIVDPNREWTLEETKTIGSELVETLGLMNENGIQCIAKPSLSTRVGHLFDMVCLDEAHTIKGMESAITKAVIRMSPKYRFAFTATPVPNTALDVFSIAGWLYIDDWYKGGRANAAFPFRREDFDRFASLFLAKERDLTREEAVAVARSRRKIEKLSPVLSSPSRLLKILKPTIAYITKQQCNPDYRPPRVIDVRVPLGTEQSRLYAYFANIANVKRTTKGGAINGNLVKHGAQIEWLRGITTDPVSSYLKNAGFDKRTPRCLSRYNPKIIAILELISECIKKGEQIVIVNSRKGITDTIHSCLDEMEIPTSRIDSSDRSGHHSEESNLFKQGNTRVMLMGIKCAVGHSYSQCKNLIIASLEYSPGPLEQAMGRVDRLTSNESMIYCMLCKDTIEEVMFDTVALKDDASKIILRGERVPRDFVPVDMSEVLLDSIMQWGEREGSTIDESDCLQQWEALKLSHAT